MSDFAYHIHILRYATSGYLSFNHNAIDIYEPCWWDPEVKIEAGEYVGIATRMASKYDGSTGKTFKSSDGTKEGKKREAILFDGKPKVIGRDRPGSGIFIHKDMGLKARASDGCIVLNGGKVLTIWRQIAPKEEKAVRITVADYKPDNSPQCHFGNLPPFITPFHCH